MSTKIKQNLKFISGAIVFGVLASLATGLVTNEIGMGIPEINRYGVPLVWRITNLNEPTQYVLTNLALDAASWAVLALIILIVVEKIMVSMLGISVNYRSLLLPLALFIPLGLFMDFIHESGHALWGTAMGGRLTYMQVAYFVIYPRLAVTSHFQLGSVHVEGLTSGTFAYGLMLLGGSMTTNIASWIIALIILKASFGSKTQIALKALGLFGILDLPFYIVFPQVGLCHWIFLGGCWPESLNGARMMGIPDSAFYLMVAISTLSLVVLYSETPRKKMKRCFTNLITNAL